MYVGCEYERLHYVDEVGEPENCSEKVGHYCRRAYCRPVTVSISGVSRVTV